MLIEAKIAAAPCRACRGCTPIPAVSSGGAGRGGRGGRFISTTRKDDAYSFVFYEIYRSQEARVINIADRKLGYREGLLRNCKDRHP